MNKKVSKTLWIVVVVIAILAALGFYVYDIVVLQSPYTDNLFRVLAVVFMLLGTLVRLSRGTSNRKSLEVYEKSYDEELGFAFQNKPLLRKKLVCACRLYNEGNYRKALKYLFQLLKAAEGKQDAIPTLLFIGLCYSDAEVPTQAMQAYYRLLELDPRNAQVHSNLGILHKNDGNFDLALQHLNKALEYNPYYYQAYNNRAHLYFQNGDHETAVDDALKALEIKNNGREAASLLAIIFSLKNDEEQKRKYYHLALTSGQNPDELNEAIQYFLNEVESDEEPDESEPLL